MPDINDLKFVRVINPLVFGRIPPELFEQIPKRNWEVQKLYAYGPIFIQNPFNAIWVMQDLANVIKGVLWITVDPIVEVIAVNILSVDREYQKLNGSLRKTPSEIIKKTVEHLHKFQDEVKQKKGMQLKREILWSTTRPRACERSGAKRHRVVMEI